MGKDEALALLAKEMAKMFANFRDIADTQKRIDKLPQDCVDLATEEVDRD